MAFDIDRHDPDDLSITPLDTFGAARQIYDRLRLLGLDPLLMDSSGVGGLHVLAIFMGIGFNCSVGIIRGTTPPASGMMNPTWRIPGGDAAASSARSQRSSSQPRRTSPTWPADFFLNRQPPSKHKHFLLESVIRDPISLKSPTSENPNDFPRAHIVHISRQLQSEECSRDMVLGTLRLFATCVFR